MPNFPLSTRVLSQPADRRYISQPHTTTSGFSHLNPLQRSPNYWSVSENRTQHNLIPISSDVPNTLEQLTEYWVHTTTRHPPLLLPSLLPPPPPFHSHRLQAALWCDFQRVSVPDRSQGRSFRMGGTLDRYATADMIPSVDKQRGVVSRHEHISREGVKQTHPPPRHKSMTCASAYLQSTQWHANWEMGSRKSGTHSILRFHLFNQSLHCLSHKSVSLLVGGTHTGGHTAARWDESHMWCIDFWILTCWFSFMG